MKNQLYQGNETRLIMVDDKGHYIRFQPNEPVSIARQYEVLKRWRKSGKITQAEELSAYTKLSEHMPLKEANGLVRLLVDIQDFGGDSLAA